MLNVSNMGNSGTLIRAITPTDTLIYLAPSQGARFQVPTGDHFFVTLREAGKHEVVQVSAVNGDSLVVARAQAGTVAQSFRGGTCVEEAWDAAQLAEFIQMQASGLGPTGVTPGTYCLNCNTCIDVNAEGRITAVNNPGGCA